MKICLQKWGCHLLNDDVWWSDGVMRTLLPCDNPISWESLWTNQRLSTTFSWFAEDVFFSGNPLRLGNRWREFFYMFCLGSWNKSKGMFGHFEYRALHFRATLNLESYARACGMNITWIKIGFWPLGNDQLHFFCPGVSNNKSKRS